MSLQRRRFPKLHRGLLLVAAGGLVACTKSPPADPTAEALADFSKRVDEYAVLHKRLADSAGTLDETKNQTDIAIRAAALAKAIQAARPDAKPGDIFTPPAATVIVALIKREYKVEPASVLEKREDTQEELPNFVPHVNELYPTSHPLATFPPNLLPLLPKLPEQLEYRIVTNYLILRDIESNLIIDFMPRAVP